MRPASASAALQYGEVTIFGQPVQINPAFMRGAVPQDPTLPRPLVMPGMPGAPPLPGGAPADWASLEGMGVAQGLGAQMAGLGLGGAAAGVPGAAGGVAGGVPGGGGAWRGSPTSCGCSGKPRRLLPAANAGCGSAQSGAKHQNGETRGGGPAAAEDAAACGGGASAAAGGAKKLKRKPPPAT